MPIIIERRVIEILSRATIPHRGPKSRSVKKYRIIHGRPIESDQLQTSAERNASIVPPPLPLLSHHPTVPLFSTVIFIACNLRNYRPGWCIDRPIDRTIDAIRASIVARPSKRVPVKSIIGLSSSFRRVLKAVWEARTSYSRISTRRWGVTHHRYRLIAPTIKDSPTCA